MSSPTEERTRSLAEDLFREARSGFDYHSWQLYKQGRYRELAAKMSREFRFSVIARACITAGFFLLLVMRSLRLGSEYHRVDGSVLCLAFFSLVNCVCLAVFAHRYGVWKGLTRAVEALLSPAASPDLAPRFPGEPPGPALEGSATGHAGREPLLVSAPGSR